MSDSDIKELRRDVGDVKNDLAKGIGAVSYMTESNEKEISEAKRERAALLRDVQDFRLTMEARLVKLEVVQGNSEESRREHTGRVRTLELDDARDEAGGKKSAAKWGTVGVVVAAGISGFASLAIHVFERLSR